MKNLLKLLGACGLLCVLFAIPATAQIVNRLTFKTTFPFYAGNTKLPAGSYTVTPSTYGSSTLEIENSTGSHSAFLDFVPTQAESGHTASDVQFKGSGNMDFLSRLWVAGQNYGMFVEPTKVEQKLAASTKAQAHSVPAEGK